MMGSAAESVQQQAYRCLAATYWRPSGGRGKSYFVGWIWSRLNAGEALPGCSKFRER